LALEFWIESLTKIYQISGDPQIVLTIVSLIELDLSFLRKFFGKSNDRNLQFSVFLRILRPEVFNSDRFGVVFDVIFDFLYLSEFEKNQEIAILLLKVCDPLGFDAVNQHYEKVAYIVGK
jgi:hypothetical protein